jgi:hypothetical protein
VAQVAVVLITSLLVIVLDLPLTLVLIMHLSVLVQEKEMLMDATTFSSELRQVAITH